MTLSTADLAYAAALVDAFAVLRIRDVKGTELPEVTIQNSRITALDWLAETTGVKVVRIGKDYRQHRCADHCPDKHTHVEAVTRRWQVTGARAVIVLHAVEPFMRVQGRQARELVGTGRQNGYSTGVVNDMTRLGWAIPELREQPRARVQLVR